MWETKKKVGERAGLTEERGKPFVFCMDVLQKIHQRTREKMERSMTEEEWISPDLRRRRERGINARSNNKLPHKDVMSALTHSNLTSSSFVAFLITPFNFAVQSFVYIFSNKFYTLLPFSKESHPFSTSLYHSYKEGCRVKAINSHSVSKAS
ncbi:hypothetical protein YC2023_052509 [Brassica napus]